MEEDVTSNASSTYERYPLKRLDFALKKLIKVTSYHLDMLKKHKENIQKYQMLELFGKVNREQTNASRTVQQLKAEISEMEAMAQHVLQPQDLPLYWKRVDPIRREVVHEIRLFLDLHTEVALPCTPKRDCRSDFFSSTFVGEAESKFSDAMSEQQQKEKLLMMNGSLMEAELTLLSWERLRQDLLDLNSSLETFACMVHSQGETIDRIENNIATANINVHRGKSFVKKALELKTYTLPLLGAVIGGAVGGPLGLIVGLKAAVVCAASGGVIGYTGARYLRKRKLGSNDEVELSLMGRRSRSTSDLNDDLPIFSQTAS